MQKVTSPKFEFDFTVILKVDPFRGFEVLLVSSSNSTIIPVTPKIRPLSDMSYLDVPNFNVLIHANKNNFESFFGNLPSPLAILLKPTNTCKQEIKRNLKDMFGFLLSSIRK